jgi:hypothetical protein
VVWVAAGASRDSVRLGVELVQAIRAKRLDIRLVLTFEEDYPELLKPLEALNKTGWGYGPGDHPMAVKRVLARFEPLGIVFAGVTPRPNLARACTQRPHTLIVAANAPATGAFEQIYPVGEAQEKSNSGQPQAPAVDFFSMLTEAQVDPNFKSLVNHGVERHLWWLHSDDADYAAGFAAGWREKFPDSVLFVSGDAVAGFKDHSLKISHWQRTMVESGSVVLMDDAKWLPAIAAACTAMHLHSLTLTVMWQAMAGGCAVSCHDASHLPKADLSISISEFSDRDTVLTHWLEYRDNPILARSRGDDARRQFWQERRLAAEINDELLQRIFEW